jgi:uncharacterized protein (TIGR00255 family)
MVNSMTGFGRGEYTQDNITFSIEVRTVNHRYTDISVRMPRLVSSLEEKVREYVNTKVSRGKIDIYINYNSFGRDAQVKLDNNLAFAYVDALNQLKAQFNIKDDINLSLLTRFSDILKIETAEADLDELWLILKEALDIAFTSLVEMRKREGERLYQDIMLKLDSVTSLVAIIKSKSVSIVDEYKSKLYERIKELTKEIHLDENRLLMEVAVFADKSSIDEEIVRLESHIQEFKKTMQLKASAGKKLDFILQEMNREINTIGSKSGDINIVNNVIGLKTDIEKVREQIQNIE